MENIFSINTSSVFAQSTALEEGMQSDEAANLQKNLGKLGCFCEECTGYFGDITEAAVKALQKEYGYIQDGIAGKDTFELIDCLLGRKNAPAPRGVDTQEEHENVESRKMAASMLGMPHAGNDGYAANKQISSRSGGYGWGANLDTVKGNNMNGVFDIHFYKSRTHSTNRVEERHQSMVKKATEWAEENY